MCAFLTLRDKVIKPLLARNHRARGSLRNSQDSDNML
jgi:hypothetical protein